MNSYGRCPCIVVAMGVLGAVAGAAELAFEVSDAGLVQALRLDGQPLTGTVTLLVPRKDWQGNHGTLREARPMRRNGDLATGPLRIEGNLSGGEDAALAYTCTLQRHAGGLRIDYEITAARDIEVAGVVAQVLLDIAPLQGREWALLDGQNVRRSPFPTELPEPYTFFSDSGFERLAWPAAGDTMLALVPDWQSVQRVTLQDDRRFGVASYEIQVYASGPRMLAPGKSVKLGFSLLPMAVAELQARQARAAEHTAALRASLTGNATATIRALTATTEPVPAFGRFEVAVELEARYDNPFDPAQVALIGHFVTPSGKEETVSGFYAWDFERALRNGVERLTPTGQGGWRVRYCPREPGQYRYRLTLNSAGVTATSPEAVFACTPSAHPGFVRVSQRSPLYFETDNGEPYFAIGENVCWPGPGGTFDYDRYWQRLAENGANYARVWIGPFDCFTLERPTRGEDDVAGLGRMDLAAAWRIDAMLDLAEQHGIRVMFCIDSFNSLRISQPYPAWSNNPYNAAHGGPLEAPEQFFTDATARTLYKNRLRYIVARWGHQPAVLSWEFWNEVDISEKYVSAEVTAWHREMGRALRSIDPYAHLITTSWAGVQGDPAVDGLPEMDYIQSHQYGAHDPASFMARTCLEKAARFGKPHYFGEFGTGTEAQGTGEDKTGIHLHDGLWSGLMSQAAGTGMLWWWDSYVEPKNLYHLFRPLAEFARGLPLTATRFQPFEAVQVRYAGTPPVPRLEDLGLLPENGSWSPASFNEPNRFVLDPDGSLANRERLSRVLHGKRNHPTLHNPPTFEVDYSRDGEFVVTVEGVSGHGGANLRIAVDGQQVLAKEFPDEDEGTATLNQYNGRYAVPIPAGRHTIQVANEGNDWLYVSYTLPGYRRRTDPGLQVYGLANGSTTPGQVAAILWLKNERHTWYLHNLGVEPGTIPPTLVTLGGIPDGSYAVEWWDTGTGKPGERQPVQATGGTLTLPAPPISTDVAAKLWRQAD
jgi:hypothetical protein